MMTTPDNVYVLIGALLDGDVKIVHDLQKSIKAPASPNKIWKKDIEARLEDDCSSYKGLGGFIVAVGSLKYSDHKIVENMFSDYQEEDSTKSVSKMRDATKLFLDIFLDTKHLREQVHSFFKRFVKGIDAVAKMIPDILKADLQLMEMLTHEIDGIKVHLEHLFPRLLHESNALLGQLDLFFVNYVMVFDYKLDDLSWDLRCPPVGSGSFADVYLAEIKSSSRRSRGSVSVALKVFRDTLKEKTVSDILLEDRTMRYERLQFHFSFLWYFTSSASWIRNHIYVGGKIDFLIAEKNLLYLSLDVHVFTFAR